MTANTIGKDIHCRSSSNYVTIIKYYNVITSSQHGFTRCRSFLTDLLEFVEEAYKRIDEGKPQM